MMRLQASWSSKNKEAFSSTHLLADIAQFNSFPKLKTLQHTKRIDWTFTIQAL